jgi:hypothetical protein
MNKKILLVILSLFIIISVKAETGRTIFDFLHEIVDRNDLYEFKQKHDKQQM